MAFRSWRMAAVVVAVALVGVPSIARAQCAKDTDCKGDSVTAAALPVTIITAMVSPITRLMPSITAAPPMEMPPSRCSSPPSTCG